MLVTEGALMIFDKFCRNVVLGVASSAFFSFYFLLCGRYLSFVSIIILNGALKRLHYERFLV